MKIKWQKLVEREGDFFKNVLLYEALEENFPKVFARFHSSFLTTRKGDIFIHYQNEEGRKEIAGFIEEQFDKDPLFVTTVIETGKKHFAELLTFCQKQASLSEQTNKRLAELLSQYCFLYKQPYPYFNLSAFADYLPHRKEIVQQMGEWRLWARDHFNKVHEFAEPLFSEIAHRLNLSLKELKFLKPKEIIDALQTKEKIPPRQQCYFIHEKGKSELFENASYPTEEGSALSSVREKNSTELKGRGTFPAQYEGNVRLILEKEDVRHIQPGEVLVLRMTTPDMMMEGIKKAGAIICDEGGITCHAAILSREFGIPTIMGTEMATKVLKTGDRVLVDAEKGIVRMI